MRGRRGDNCVQLLNNLRIDSIRGHQVRENVVIRFSQFQRQRALLEERLEEGIEEVVGRLDVGRPGTGLVERPQGGSHFGNRLTHGLLSRLPFGQTEQVFGQIVHRVGDEHFLGTEVVFDLTSPPHHLLEGGVCLQLAVQAIKDRNPHQIALGFRETEEMFARFCGKLVSTYLTNGLSRHSWAL